MERGGAGVVRRRQAIVRSQDEYGLALKRLGLCEEAPLRRVVQRLAR